MLRVHSGEENLMRRDGTIVPVQRTMAPVFNRLGRFCDLISVVEDVSEKKRLEEHAAHAEMHYRTVLNALPDHVYVKNVEGCFELANEAWVTARSLTLEDVRGKTVHDIFEPGVALGMEEQDGVLLAGAAPSVDFERRSVSRHSVGTEHISW